MRIGIAWKVSLALVGVMFALGTALGGFFAGEQQVALRRELDRRVELTGVQLAMGVGHALESEDLSAMKRFLAEAALDHEIAYVRLKGSDGELLAAHDERPAKAPVTEYAFPFRALHRGEPHGEHGAASFAGAERGGSARLPGSVVIGVNLSPLRAAQRRIVLRTLAAVLIGAVLATLLGVAAVRGVLGRDLGTLLAGMRDVGAGDLSRRVQMGGRDELARIGEAFDEMAERLSSTVVSKQHLEGTVAQRTAELSRALAEAERAQAGLAEREERLRLLLDSTAEAIYGIDLDGVCTFCNPACVRLLGYSSADELVGRNLHALIHHSRRDGSPSPREACGVSRTLHAGAGHHGADDVLWRADGTPLEVEWWSYPMSRGGTRVGAVVTFVDVGERKKLEGEILKMRKLESVALLAGGIAHDFNNLLTGILGNVSLAKECAPEGGDLRELLDEAEAATLRTKALTRQLLTFSRGGAPVKQAIALGEVVHEAARFALSGSAIAAEYAFPSEPWPVEADAGQIGQVIHNLVINAVQAMPGGGRIRVSVENVTLGEVADLPLPPGSYAKVTVADEGVGIPAEHLPQVFDPYFSTKREGSGLGLATVYSIVRNHGGHVAVASAATGGSTFDVYLPVARSSAEPRPEPARPARGGGRVLLMDDDAAVRNVGRTMLTRLGYEVTTAADGREAVERFDDARRAGRPPDVVVLDLTVPGGMGGEEALRALRAIDPGVRAVVTSGYSNDPVMSRYREHGFDAIVAKPYTAGELAAAVAEAVAPIPAA